MVVQQAWACRPPWPAILCEKQGLRELFCRRYVCRPRVCRGDPLWQTNRGQPDGGSTVNWESKVVGESIVCSMYYFCWTPGEPLHTYYKEVLLPKIPSDHKLGTKSCLAGWSEQTSVGSGGTYSHTAKSSAQPRRQYKISVGTTQYAGSIQYPRNRAVMRYARCANASRLTCGSKSRNIFSARREEKLVDRRYFFDYSHKERVYGLCQVKIAQNLKKNSFGGTQSIYALRVEKYPQRSNQPP